MPGLPKVGESVFLTQNVDEFDKPTSIFWGSANRLAKLTALGVDVSQGTDLESREAYRKGKPGCNII
jgi:hypothetical protein